MILISFKPESTFHQSDAHLFSKYANNALKFRCLHKAAEKLA